jgi:hypothetical protein
LPEPKVDDELPPLDGDATRVTVAMDAATRAAAAVADAEDPPAPPPEDTAPTKEPQTPMIPSPEPVLGGVTYEMPAVPAPSAEGDTATLERPALPSLSTLVVQKLSDAQMPTPKTQPQPSLPARGPEEPRVTLKTMKAATAPGWNPTLSATRPSRSACRRGCCSSSSASSSASPSPSPRSTSGVASRGCLIAAPQEPAGGGGGGGGRREVGRSQRTP